MTRISSVVAPIAKNLPTVATPLAQALDLAGLRTLHARSIQRPLLTALDADRNRTGMSSPRSAATPPRSFKSGSRHHHALSLAGLPFAQQGRPTPQARPSPFRGIQNRGKFTVLMDSHRLNGLLENPALKALLKDASFVGLHGSSDANVKGIGESGIDLALSGENWGTYSSAGPGLYTTKEPRLAMWYGLHAANRTPGGKAQLLAIFRLPTSEPVVRRPLLQADANDAGAAHEVVQDEKYSEEFVETLITPAGLDSPHIEYVAVPLPRFEAMQQKEVEAELTAFVKKASS